MKMEGRLYLSFRIFNGINYICETNKVFDHLAEIF